MPELPEVETVVRGLQRANLQGQVIQRARVFSRRLIGTTSEKQFIQRLQGHTLKKISRRGKYIVMELNDGWFLLVHLRMTGQFVLQHQPAPHQRHQHIILWFANGIELRYQDPRQFGRWTLTSDPATILNKLGPEPLTSAFRSTDFVAKLAQRKTKLKPLLLDQTFVAGLGNIYVDESLWEARLHPERQADSLNAVEAQALFTAIKQVLRRSIRNAGTTLGSGQPHFADLEGRQGRHQWRLHAYQQTGKPCGRCATPIKKMVLAQRGTHYCPNCQRLPLPDKKK